MSEVKHKKIELTGDVQVIEVNVMYAITKLASRGELKITSSPCTQEITMSLGDHSVTRAPMKDDATGYISPVALCLCDLLDLVKKKP